MKESLNQRKNESEAAPGEALDKKYADYKEKDVELRSFIDTLDAQGGSNAELETKIKRTTRNHEKLERELKLAGRLPMTEEEQRTFELDGKNPLAQSGAVTEEEGQLYLLRFSPKLTNVSQGEVLQWQHEWRPIDIDSSLKRTYYTVEDLEEAHTKLSEAYEAINEDTSNNPDTMRGPINQWSKKVHAIERALKEVGEIPASEEERIGFILDRMYPEKGNKEIVAFRGKKYQRRFRSNVRSRSRKSVTQWDKRWYEVKDEATTS